MSKTDEDSVMSYDCYQCNDTGCTTITGHDGKYYQTACDECGDPALDMAMMVAKHKTRADAAEARLGGIAGILDAVQARLMARDGLMTQSMASGITMEELSEIYEYATLDRPVVEPLPCATNK